MIATSLELIEAGEERPFHKDSVLSAQFRGRFCGGRRDAARWVFVESREPGRRETPRIDSDESQAR